MNYVVDNPRDGGGNFTDADRLKLEETHTASTRILMWIESHTDKHEEIDRRLNSHSSDIKELTRWQDRWKGILTVSGVVSALGAIVWLVIKEWK